MKKTILTKTASFLFILLTVVIACSQKNTEETQSTDTLSTKDINKSKNLTKTYNNLTVSAKDTSKNSFIALIDSVLPLIDSLGFNPKPFVDTIIETAEKREHWLLKRYFRISESTDSFKTSRYPNAILSKEQFSTIKRIRKARFRHKNTRWKESPDLLLERWQFLNEGYAKTWKNTLDKNKKNYFTKPPLTFFQSGNYLYIVSTRAAMWLDPMYKIERRLKKIVVTNP